MARTPLSVLQAMSVRPIFVAPAHFDDPELALAAGAGDLRAPASSTCASALQRFVAGEDARQHVRACYPFVRVHTATVARADSRLAYGFVAGPGTYETTLTRPDLFGALLPRAVRAAAAQPRRAAGGRHQHAADPGALRTGRARPLEGSDERRAPAADARPVRPARPGGDGRRHRQRHAQDRRGEPATAGAVHRTAVDYSLQRLRHYTGTAPEHFQNFVLFTNYQFYIDEFIKLGHQLMADPQPTTIAFVEPGNVLTRRAGEHRDIAAAATAGGAPPRLPQMPAYHLVRGDHGGITMVNIGVGPANAKTITDHIAVLRPHAWLMLGHCAGLRNTQQLGDYVLAHGYVREDHVLDEDLPLWVPIPALAEVQLALEQAVADVTRLRATN
jgi:AMP nucleosidase